MMGIFKNSAFKISSAKDDNFVYQHLSKYSYYFISSEE